MVLPIKSSCSHEAVGCFVIHCGFHMTILRKFGPPLHWPIVPLGPGFHGKYVAEPWYRFLAEGDFVHGDELLFYYRSREDIWEMVIRKQRNWGDNDDW